MRRVEQLRDIEDFLDGEIAQGRTLAEIREDVSSLILLTELHELHPGRNMEFFVEAGMTFLGTERKQR